MPGIYELESYMYQDLLDLLSIPEDNTLGGAEWGNVRQFSTDSIILRLPKVIIPTNRRHVNIIAAQVSKVLSVRKRNL